jgi:hypothetical protein
MRELIAEIKEEFIDFIEDYKELIRRQPPSKDMKQKPAVLSGEMRLIRPAYLFAERVENGIKFLFGGSVVLSAITSTFIGFASLSGLVDTLLKSLPGRAILLIIGLSYLIIALWKTLHLNKSVK